MQVDDIWITGIGAAMAPRELVCDAVARGEYDPEEAERTQQTAVAVAPPETPATAYAVGAGEAAMEQAGIETAGLLLHCVVRDSGCSGWTAAPYIQKRLGIPDAVPVELRVGCNPIIAWQLAAQTLRGMPAYRNVLVTAADVWQRPEVNRWESASGFSFGDGGGAVAFSRMRGVARMLSIHTDVDTEMEALTRGAHPMHGPSPIPLDLRERAKEFLETVMSKDEQWERRDEGMARTVRRVLDESGAGMPDIARIVVNHVGRELLEREVLSVIGAPIERTTWEYGRMIGHLGAADAAVSLRHAIETPGLMRGDLVLVICTAAGYTWGAVVLELEQDSGTRPEGAAA